MSLTDCRRQPKSTPPADRFFERFDAACKDTMNGIQRAAKELQKPKPAAPAAPRPAETYRTDDAEFTAHRG